jgi:outer membrane translocation and assembly module TamA
MPVRTSLLNWSTVFLILGSTAVCQTAHTSHTASSSPAPDLSQYRLEAVDFVGNHAVSTEQIRDAFHVPVGNKFDHTAVDQGLDRLRQLYGDNGYVNFTAVPMLQLNKALGTVVLTVSIDDGPQFTFGRLFFEGQEPRAGETEALRNAWTALSAKVYSSSLLDKWLAENATFLPKDGQPPRRHVEIHLDLDTKQADFLIAFPDPKP